MKALPLFEIILYITSYRLQNTQQRVFKKSPYADKSTLKRATWDKFSILLVRGMVVYIALWTTAIFWENIWYYKAGKEHVVFSGSESFMLTDIVFLLETDKYLDCPLFGGRISS